NEEKGDDLPAKFSYSDVTKPLVKQKSCHMTYTSLEVHDILREGFDRSPMFNGRIQSLGPRYCPSIEDKINRFADKERHQDRKSTRLNSSHVKISYAVFCLKKKNYIKQRKPYWERVRPKIS